MSKISDYHNKMNKLYQSWEQKVSSDGKINHSKNSFVQDGVLCPGQWFVQDIRPMFLLKEAYGEPGSLIDYLMKEEEPMPALWRNVCEWTEGILVTSKDTMPMYQNTKHKNNGNETLKKIAVVNIKKSDGKPSSDMKEIEEYASFDKKELMQEIEYCDPTIIICGYTIESLNIISNGLVKDKRHIDKYGIYAIEINGHKVTVIDYYHPSNHFPKIMNYITLMRIYQLSLQRGIM